MELATDKTPLTHIEQVIIVYLIKPSWILGHISLIKALIMC